MGKRPVLSEIERGKIDAYLTCGKSVAEISKLLKRSVGVIYNYKRDPGNYSKNFNKKGNPRLTEKDKRRIIRSASQNGCSSKQICTDLRLPVTSRRVRQILSTSQSLRWSKMKAAPKLTDRHKKQRLEYCDKYMEMGQKWKNVIFSDEKKFNLDGPDGLKYYWRDLRKEPKSIFSRNFGGGSLMVWAAISFNARSEIVFLEGRQTSFDYSLTLENYLLPFAWQNYGFNFIFMQDNASIHTSNEMKNWFKEQNIALLDHPPNSPDLNPMENVWAALVRMVYANGQQYTSIAELRASIKQKWTLIDQKYIQNLILSMKDRIKETLMKKGDFTKY